MGMTLNNRNGATIPARIKQLERIKRDELNGTIVLGCVVLCFGVLFRIVALVAFVMLIFCCYA